METVFAMITNTFGTALDMVTDVGETIVGTPLLLMFCVLPLVGIGIGIFKRLMRV